MNGTALALFLYLVAVVAVGLWSARRSGRDLGEFYLGGRSMGNLVVALSAVVSGRSAWLMMGVVGATFVKGVQVAWFIPGYVVMELFLFLFAARRLRRFTERHEDVTFIDYLASRFRDQGVLLRVVAALIIVIFFIAYVGAQLKAGQVMFTTLFGWESVLAGVVLMAAIVGVYTILGGYRAVAITDVIQALLMIVGLVILPVVAISRAGGLEATWQALETIGETDEKFSMLGLGSLVGLLSGLGIGLGSPGNPHILVRYMSVDSPARLRTTALVGTLWNVLLGWGAVYTGLAARALYSPDVLPDPNNQAFVHMAQELFHPFVAGLMLAALVAAIMSTADSQLLVISSSITRDLYEKVFRRGQTVAPRTSVLLGRLSVAVVIIGAALLSWISAEAGTKSVFSTVFSYVLLAWSGLGTAFGPPFLVSLFWHRATRAGALASIISGPLCCILWIALGYKASTGVHEILPAFGVSLVLMLVVSLVTRPPERAGELLADMRP